MNGVCDDRERAHTKSTDDFKGAEEQIQEKREPEIRNGSVMMMVVPVVGMGVRRLMSMLMLVLVSAVGAMLMIVFRHLFQSRQDSAALQAARGSARNKE